MWNDNHNDNPVGRPTRNSSSPWRPTRDTRLLCLVIDLRCQFHLDDRPETLSETNVSQRTTKGTDPSWRQKLDIDPSRHTTRVADPLQRRQHESVSPTRSDSRSLCVPTSEGSPFGIRFVTPKHPSGTSTTPTHPGPWKQVSISK